MNILHLEASSGWGGQEIRILREAEGMRDRGHFVAMAVSQGGSLVKQARDAGFVVYELNFKKIFWPICLLKLLVIIFRHQIHVLNTHSSLDSWIGGIAARLSRRAVVRTRHLSTPIKQGLNSRLLYGKLADFVVTTCASIVPMISQQSGKNLQLCKSIPTGVNPDKIQVNPEETRAFREKIGVRPDEFLVGTVCVMRSWKGVDDLLRAADILRDVPKLKWVVVGGGHAERHRRLAQELKLDGIVHFTGHLNDPFPAMAAIDLFALLSTANEGVSQAILQAAFLEKPLISTKTGGLAEVCVDQITGLNVKPFNPNEVADAVMTIFRSTTLAQRFGKKAKELVLERFTMSVTLDQMEDVYSQVEYKK